MISDTAIMKEIMHHRNPSLENPLAYGQVPEGKKRLLNRIRNRQKLLGDGPQVSPVPQESISLSVTSSSAYESILS